MSAPAPFYLDVDGTMLKVDLLYEALWAGCGRAPRAPRATLIACLKHWRQPVTLKTALTEIWDLRLDLMPLNEEITEIARADLPVWQEAQAAVIVERAGGAAGQLAQAGVPVTPVGGGWSLGALAKGLRPHQWVKNVLLLLPLIAAHSFGLESFLLAAMGMIAFSAAASAIYVINDLLDLEAVRLHVTKRHRPFASGLVPIQIGMMVSLFCAVVAIGVGALLGPDFVAVVLLSMA